MFFFRSRTVNITAIVVSTLVCWWIFRRSYIHNNFEVGYYLLPMIPVLIGLVTFGMYLVADKLSHDNGWIATIAGAVFNFAWLWMSLQSQQAF